jgi:hypothetical protein
VWGGNNYITPEHADVPEHLSVSTCDSSRWADGQAWTGWLAGFMTVVNAPWPHRWGAVLGTG